jgi:2-methylcitrate dehydratase PrpD
MRNMVRTRYEDIPEQAIAVTKKQILDCVGVALAGSSAEGVRELVDLSREWGGREQSSVIYHGIKVPAPNAAQINATMTHALDFDDTHDTAVMHPGAVTVTTGFATAERQGMIRGKALLLAVALGTDLMCRLGLATNTGASRLKAGWHFTAIFGFLGAAAVAGRILDLDEDRMMHALGIAYHQSAGNGQCVIDGALTKRMGPGFAAKGGITAALMAEKGITGAKNCLEGEMGLYNLYYRGAYNPQELTAELGKRYEGINLSFKPYPSCRATHPFIDAALSLVRDHDIQTDRIDMITVFHGEGAKILCEPLETRRRPRNPVDSQFNIPWVVAVAIAKRQVAIHDFTEAGIRDEAVLEVSGKITPRFDESLKRPALEPGRVEIKTKNGKVFSYQVDDPSGSPANPMTFDDCVRKFFDCAAHAARQLPKDHLDRVVEMVERLERVDDATEVIGLVSRA